MRAIWGALLFLSLCTNAFARIDASKCSLLLSGAEKQSEAFKAAALDGFNYYSHYLNQLNDLGIITEDEFRKTIEDRGRSQAEALIRSKLTLEELALIRQIKLHQNNADYNELHLSQKIKSIFQGFDRGPIRNSQLLLLRREVYVRRPDIERVFEERMQQISKGDIEAGKTFNYGEDGLLHAIQLQSFDDITGLATIRTETGEIKTSPIGDIYGRMPTEQVRRWGFLEAERWQYGKTSLYVHEVKWQKVGEKQTSFGPVTLISSPDLPHSDGRWVYSYIKSDPRTITQELAFMRELGFAYDAKTGIQTIPSVEVVNYNLDRTHLSPYRLIQVYDRGETPTLTFARALVQNLIPIGIEGLQVHDYSAHLAERLALPIEIFAVLKDRLNFWLSVYDHPALKKNNSLQKFCELMILRDVFDYDNLSLGDYLFGINFLQDDPPKINREFVLLDRQVRGLTRGIHGDFGASAFDVAKKYLDRFKDGRFESNDLHYAKPGEYGFDRPIFRAEISPEEMQIFKMLAAQAPRSKVTEQMVRDLLGSQEFLYKFTRPRHPLLKKNSYN